MEEKKQFDVIIVGAGPAGCVAAYQLGKSKLKVALIEKGTFPRDKICGDALSPDVTNQLRLIDEKLIADFQKLSEKRPAKKIHFFAPNHERLDLDFKKKLDSYVAKRIDFDNFLFQQLKKTEHLDILEGVQTQALSISEQGVSMKTDQGTFHAPIILGADGANSFVKRNLQGKQLDKDHYCAGLRQYYQGVEGITPDSGIELHFYKEALPGYLWIFPLPNDQANVGIGMLSSAISKHKIDLKKMMQELITTHPKLKDRFKNARAIEKVKGFGLPIGSRKVKCSGNRYLLLGDAASLIDPFTGEGIGNAIRSGRVAADHILDAFKVKRFDAAFHRAYDHELYRRMWSELRISRFLQKMLKYPWLFNYVVKKANKNEAFRTLITASLEDVDLRKQFRSPAFYFKLFFK